jgi:hypothetical protein
VTAKYQNSIKINVPDTVAFNILEDYENYPNIIPIFHSAVKITSENRTGIGVRFNNVSVWGGYKMESTYKVVEYKLNEYIKLKNMTQYGLSELIVSKVGNNETEYTLINYTKIPFYMKKKLFKSFDNELEIIKQMCENGL